MSENTSFRTYSGEKVVKPPSNENRLKTSVLSLCFAPGTYPPEAKTPKKTILDRRRERLQSKWKI